MDQRKSQPDRDRVEDFAYAAVEALSGRKPGTGMNSPIAAMPLGCASLIRPRNAMSTRLKRNRRVNEITSGRARAFRLQLEGSKLILQD